jgi:hypothetical protein
MSITQPVCVCVCSLRYPASNAHALYWHLWPAPLYHIFPHYLINGMILERKKKLLNTKCGFWFSLQILSETFLRFSKEKKLLNTKCGFSFSLQILSETFFILRRTERDVISSLHVKYRLLLSDCTETWIFSTDFQKITNMSNFMKIRSVGAELFHADGRTDGRTWRS